MRSSVTKIATNSRTVCSASMILGFIFSKRAAGPRKHGVTAPRRKYYTGCPFSIGMLPMNSNVKNMLGLRFGKLLVIERGPGIDKFRSALWICKCDCGMVKTISSRLLNMKRHVKSCGCLVTARRSVSSERVREIWRLMHRRCYQRNHLSYKKYGALSIKVCDRWRVFSNFFEDMGEPPTEQHTLDRIDGARDYEPDNCRWATFTEQNCNRKNNVWIDFYGHRVVLSEACRRLGIHTSGGLSRKIRANPILVGPPSPFIKEGRPG